MSLTSQHSLIENFKESIFILVFRIAWALAARQKKIEYQFWGLANYIL